MRIAIVGAGISGLVVADLLHREHEITVFEAADYAGGHTNTIRVDTPNETHHGLGRLAERPVRQAGAPGHAVVSPDGLRPGALQPGRP